jgi:hypothetical protein
MTPSTNILYIIFTNNSEYFIYSPYLANLLNNKTKENKKKMGILAKCPSLIYKYITTI